MKETSVVILDVRGADGINRVFTTLRARGLELISATIGEADEAGVYPVCLRVRHPVDSANAVSKFLGRIVSVTKVSVLQDSARSMALMTAAATPDLLRALVTIDSSRVRILEFRDDLLLLEVNGTTEEIKAIRTRVGGDALHDFIVSGPVVLRRAWVRRLFGAILHGEQETATPRSA